MREYRYVVDQFYVDLFVYAMWILACAVYLATKGYAWFNREKDNTDV